MEPDPLKRAQRNRGNRGPARFRAYGLLVIFGLLNVGAGMAVLAHRHKLGLPLTQSSAPRGEVNPQSSLPSNFYDSNENHGDTQNPKSTLADGSAPHRVIDPWRGRAERDAMRERIYRAFGEPIPDQPAADAAAAAAVFMPETEAGAIDPSYIQDRVHDDLFPLARECYGELLARSPDAGGRLSIDFTIVGDPSVGGIVESAELNGDTTLADKAMAECVRQSMLSMTFAPPPHGGKVTVVYPIDFSPDEPDASK